VASFNFPESELLGELYAQALDDEGVATVHESALGPRELVAPALEQGRVDVVPEYLGTAYDFFGGEEEPTPARLDDLLSERGLTVLEPAPAENQNAFVVTQARSIISNLRAVSDLATVAPTLKLGGPPECPERPFCLLGLERVYGLEFEDFEPLNIGGPLPLASLRGGEVDVVLLFSTDGNLARSDDLVVLEDDRGLQPPENVVPAVRRATLDRLGGRLADAFDRVSLALTTEELRALNQSISLDGEDPADVARRWLRGR